MNTIKQFFIFSIFSLFILGTAWGQIPTESKFTLEPVYGLETRLVRFPEPSRYVTSATYGVRALYGTSLLSGEAEFTTNHSRKDYPAEDLSVSDKIDRFSLGARTTLPFGKYVGLYIRGGGVASKGKTEIKTSGLTETNDNPLRIDPFGGSGIQVAFNPNMAVNCNVTLIRNAEGKFDAQYTLGLSAKFGNR